MRLSTPGTFAYVDERHDEDRDYWGEIVVVDPSQPPASEGARGGSGNGGSAAGGGSTAPSSATIRIVDRAFAPRSVTIAAGGAVTWRNDDDREHTASDSGGFDSGVLAPGESHRERFPSPGTFSFLCFLHPDMTGTVTVVASGGGDGESPIAPTATPEPTPAPTVRPVEDGASMGSSVEIVDLDFRPGELTVEAGTSITWANIGVAPHTATADDGSFDSGVLASGERWTQRFDAPGHFAYACAIHPDMRGVVIVRSAGSPSPSSAADPPATSAATDSPSPEAAVAVGADPGSAGDASETRSETAAAGGATIVGTLLTLALIVGAALVVIGIVLGAAEGRATRMRGTSAVR